MYMTAEDAVGGVDIDPKVGRREWRAGREKEGRRGRKKGKGEKGKAGEAEEEARCRRADAVRPTEESLGGYGKRGWRMEEREGGKVSVGGRDIISRLQRGGYRGREGGRRVEGTKREWRTDRVGLTR
eukprot:GHVU01109690.1.p4 GENE.GHVU01109690.1~~GHVU01109690.1.p4  ORF type:complete len:127 (-),score=21.73 GHVU01109690.1:1443-1823(-)